MSSSYITDESPAGAYETIAVSTAVVAPTAGNITSNQAGGFYKRAVKIFMTVETNSIRVTWDGTTPVAATTGHLLTAGSSLTVIGEQNVSRLKMIRSTADATVQVTYYYNL